MKIIFVTQIRWKKNVHSSRRTEAQKSNGGSIHVNHVLIVIKESFARTMLMIILRKYQYVLKCSVILFLYIFMLYIFTRKSICKPTV